MGGSCLGKIEPVGASHCVGGNGFLQADNEYSIDAVKRGLGRKSDLNLKCADLAEKVGNKLSLGNVFVVVDTGKPKSYIGIANSIQ